MKHPIILFVLALILLGAFGASAQDAPSTPMTRFLEQNQAQSCGEPASSFQCVSITVPVDHTDAANDATLDVVFAIQPARDPAQRRGMFVTVTGGPGYSGLHAAEVYSSYFYPELLDSFDIVFFDQRGIGRSEGVRCDDEALTYYLADTPDQDALVAAAQQFAADCMAAIDRPDLLPFLGTTQAVEDLELFRQAVGDEQIWLYGESYGTQFSQTYAAAHARHLAGLVLDGVVDLTLTAPQFYEQQDAAFANALQLTFIACEDNPACVGDFPNGDPEGYYNALSEQLSMAPQPVEVTLPNGTSETRELTAAMLESAYIDAMYGEYGRADFLRELAAAAAGNFVPLLRHAYWALYLDPVDLSPVPDEGWSDGAYYAIECNDYVYSVDQSDPVCAFWTIARPPQERPAPLTVDVPTLILNATADPATPIQNGYDVASRLPNARSITMQGGPHVIYGRGSTCPDDQVTAFLVTGALPNSRDSICPGVVIATYEPLDEADEAWLTALDYE